MFRKLAGGVPGVPGDAVKGSRGHVVYKKFEVDQLVADGIEAAVGQEAVDISVPRGGNVG